MTKQNTMSGKPLQKEVSKNDSDLYYHTEVESLNKWQDFKDSFKPQQKVAGEEDNGNTKLKRSLKNRHLQMIAIGGSVGTGLLIGLGSCLHEGGPAALLIAWGIVGTMVFCTVHALGELCIEYPVNGAFSSYAARFVDPSWGFAVGWNYGIMWLIVLPVELVAAAMSIQYWNLNINPVAWVSIFYVLIMGINLFGVKIYGEAEFWLAIVKVIAIVGFIILGVVLVCGGGPTHDFVGNRYWVNPGPFANGFKGVVKVFVTASYSLAGSEMVGLASAETANPRKTLPKAIKQVFWRIFFFYFLSLTFIGLLVPYTSDDLLGASDDASASPFVIAIKNGGIHALPSIFNAVILISVTSVGNSAVYGCSRTIQSLGMQGLGPKFLGYVDRNGRPLGGLACSAVFGLLCFLSAYHNEGVVFGWLLSVAGLGSIFLWMSINICHVRFRMAMKKQDRSLDDLSYKSVTGIYGSIYAVGLLILVLILQFWVALFPGSTADANNFFQNYLGVIVVLVFYICHKLYARNWRIWIPLDEIDLETGKRSTDLELLKFEIFEEQESTNHKPLYLRLWNFWC